ncbi:MAG: hypothetical protein AAGF55_01030 [Pseudomonadota bacterium]
MTFADKANTCHSMEMGRIKRPLGTAIDPAIAERLEAWIKENPPWRKVDVIEKALLEFLDKADRDDEEQV